ncbi:hypothetical protein SAMN04488089_102128 [Myroides profundi]|uniref:Uncharacterized protein n=1 Tax=Myroides profundi TaxID=480520 RepID=A0AAJ4W405_MYRPR|nr:hypothetical protein SAMN04488089_102128 [Myroides profundi]
MSSSSIRLRKNYRDVSLSLQIGNFPVSKTTRFSPEGRKIGKRKEYYLVEP